MGEQKDKATALEKDRGNRVVTWKRKIFDSEKGSIFDKTKCFLHQGEGWLKTRWDQSEKLEKGILLPVSINVVIAKTVNF